MAAVNHWQDTLVEDMRALIVRDYLDETAQHMLCMTSRANVGHIYHGWPRPLVIYVAAAPLHIAQTYVRAQRPQWRRADHLIEAIKHENHEVVAWMRIETWPSLCETAKWAARYDDLDTLQWLYYQCGWGKNIGFIMLFYCLVSNRDTTRCLQWLHHTEPNLYPRVGVSPFVEGHLKNIEWLLNTFQEPLETYHFGFARNMRRADLIACLLQRACPTAPADMAQARALGLLPS